MKSFILKTILVALPVVVAAFAMEIGLRHIPNDYAYKNNYLKQHAAEIETLILGSSQEYYGLNPEYFSGEAFNACHVSQGYDMDFALLNKYISEMQSLKTLILPVSYTSISMDIENSAEAWRYKNYVIYYGLDRWRVNNSSELLAMKSSVNLKRLRDYYLDRKDEITCSALGWGKNFKAENSSSPEETVGNMRRHTVGSPERLKAVVEKNRREMQKIIDLARERGATVILYATPISDAYRRNRLPAQRAVARHTAAELASVNSCCRVLDLSDDPRFTDADFFDADHLNDIGAKKLSIIVNGWQ